MDIYFVRHAQTLANKERRHQTLDEEVTEEGKMALNNVATQLQSLSPTHLYTSPVRRTQQSAEYLSELLHLPVRQLALVEEMKYANTVMGKHHFSLGTLVYGARWFFSRRFKERYPEAESRQEFFERFKETERFFETNHQANDVIVIVSHSFYIIGFVLHLLEQMPRSLWRMLPYVPKTIFFPNSGLTHVAVRCDDDGSCTWLRKEFGVTTLS